MFIMIDGIDGSGKSTVMRTWQTLLTERQYQVFSLKDFWTEKGRHPEPHEIPADTFAIFSAEPTSVWAGAAIREEMVQRNGRTYTGSAMADAFALDRLVLYTRVLVPAMARGMHVIQDRGVSTSLCYQSCYNNHELSMTEIAGREGNAFALAHRPDVLMLMDVPPERCMERLAMRATQKDDNAIFEYLAFQEELDACYRSDTFTEFFTSRGTILHRFPADQELDILESQLRALLSQYLSVEL
jgi:thymidylate kinase